MKKKKMIKIIAWILGILLLICALGIGGIWYYWNRKVLPNLLPQTAQNNATEVLPDTELPNNVGEILIEQVEAIIQESDMQDYLNRESPKEVGRLLNLLESAKQKKEEKTAPAPSPEVSAALPTEKPKSTKSAYEKYKDQIDPKDLAAGLALASKVDVGYILGLLSGGLTAEERSELKQYLMQRMSSSEISKGIQLFSKYSYLL